MNKILLIIKREYLTRVKNKAFILTTLLTPLLIAALIGASIFFQVKGKSIHKVAVVDKNGFFKSNMKDSKDVTFEFPADVDTGNFIKKGYTDILIIPDFKDTIKKQQYIIRSQKSLGIETERIIKDKLNTAIEDKKLQDEGIDKSKLDSIHKQSQIAELTTLQQNEGGGAKESHEGIAIAIGYVSGFLIYLTMLIYGMMVMRGIMEEKTNRIAEVIISSVKPFQLMTGKIIGIGAVGITQFLLWIILIFVFSTIGTSLLSPDIADQLKNMQQNNGAMPGAMGAVSTIQPNETAQAIYKIQSINWVPITILFMFYFVGGYLFYAALFAAVGSVIEDAQSGQSLTLPIIMPIIFSFFILTSVARLPDTSLAVWSSIIPFSSPIIMMARVAYGVPSTVPYWQLAASMLSLIGGFLFTTWMAGKIYRTGILMYGKKVTLKEMLKWAFKKSA
jgi:ABC-2 type transport system permease protein